MVIQFVVLFTLSLLFWEALLRLHSRIKKRRLSFSITHDTLLDQNFGIPDCYANEEWFRSYMLEAKKIFRHTVWTPYVYWRMKPFYGQHINVSADGQRKTWNKIITATEPFTIYMFGGSTLWGWGARDEYTIPSQVSKLLNEKAPQVQFIVHNFGQLGYVSTQEVLFLINQLKANHRPQLVVFYDGLNDMFSAYQSGMAGIPQNEMDRKQASLQSKFSLLWQSLQKKSALCQFKTLSLAGDRTDFIDPAHFKKLAREIVTTYLNNLEIVSALADRYSFNYLSYWQPILFTKAVLSSFEKQLLTCHAFWEPLSDEVFSYLEQHPISHHHFSNISHLLHDVEETIFIDPWHINENGNKIIANRIVKDVLNQLHHPTLMQNNKECV